MATLHAAISLILTDKALLMSMFIPHVGVCNDSEIAESVGFPFSKRMAYREVLSPFQHILRDIMATR